MLIKPGFKPDNVLNFIIGMKPFTCELISFRQESALFCAAFGSSQLTNLFNLRLRNHPATNLPQYAFRHCMHAKSLHSIIARRMALLLGCALLLTACKTTKHVPEGWYLLRSNSLKLKS